jgi:uncharacterized repeat protein (TIGR01451 family)
MNKSLSKLMSVAAIFLLLTGAIKAQVATGGNYKLEQSVIASGGGTSAGAANTFSITGTIGQPAAGTEMSGAPFAQLGGFWAALDPAVGVEAPAISKSFSPTSVNVNEVSTLTITLTNPSTNTVALSGVGVTDSFPSGLQVDATASAVNTCGGTFTASASATSISLTEGTIPINGSCLLSVRVKATTAGEKVNITGAVTSTNGGTGTTASATLTVNQSTLTYSISGAVSYGNTPLNQMSRFVSGVNFSVTGAPASTAVSDSTGFYQLSGLNSGGNYTVIPAKTGNINGITPFDATLVLRCVAAGPGCTLTPNQLIAADVNNSGDITPFDATQILRFVAANGQTNATGSVGNWKFNPVSLSYNPLNNSFSNENYAAFLVGEVSGDWMP